MRRWKKSGKRSRPNETSTGTSKRAAPGDGERPFRGGAPEEAGARNAASGEAGRRSELDGHPSGPYGGSPQTPSIPGSGPPGRPHHWRFHRARGRSDGEKEDPAPAF